jgi:hypothetical protein
MQQPWLHHAVFSGEARAIAGRPSLGPHRTSREDHVVVLRGEMDLTRAGGTNFEPYPQAFRLGP